MIKKLNPFSRHGFLTIALVILALVFVVYYPALNASFELDAHYVVENNPTIKQKDLISSAFSRHFFDAYKSTFQAQLHYYRPIVTLSFAWNYTFAKNNPLGYRVVNCLLNVINGILIFYLLYFLFRNTSLAIIATLFFVIHPTNEWVVNYIVGRGDLLQQFFLLITSITIILSLEKQNFILLLMSICSFILSLLSRETAIIFPAFAVLIAYTYSDDRKRSAIVFALFSTISLVYYFLRKKFLPITQTASLESFSFSALQDWIVISTEYFSRFLFPWSIQAQLPILWKHVVVLAALIFFPIVIPAIIWRGSKNKFNNSSLDLDSRLRGNDIRNKNKEFIYFGLLWILLSFIPLYVTRNMFTKLGPYLAEHFLYWSTIGFVLCLSAFILSLPSKVQKIIGALVFTYFLVTTITNNTHWTTEEHLLRHIHQTEKGGDTVAYQQLLMRFDDNVQEIKRMEDMADSNVTKSIWLRRLGDIYRSHKDYPNAIATLRQAVDLNPQNLDAGNELGICFFENGDDGNGFQWLYRTLIFDPENVDANRFFGQKFYLLEDYSHAISHLKKSLYYNPEQPEVLKYLAMSYYLNHELKSFDDIVSKYFATYHDAKPLLTFIIDELRRHQLNNEADYLLKANNLK